MKAIKSIPYLTATLIGGGLIWAGNAEVLDTVSAEGTVVVEGQNKVAQHLEGGIVEELLVKQGEHVKAGQPIAKISPVQAEAIFGEREQRVLSLKARVARLIAEAEGTDPEFNDLPETAIQAELKVLDARRNEHQLSIGTFEKEITALKTEEESLIPLMRNAEANYKLISQLHSQKATSKADLIKAEGILAERKAQLTPIPGKIILAENNILKEKASFISRARQELANSEADLASANESLAGMSDRLKRTEVISPVNGIIKTLHISGEGQVIQPGGNVAEIVPETDGLVVEAKLRPEDIRGIRNDLSVKVRLTAFDVSKFGSLDGKVISISPDASSEERSGEPYYSVMLRTAGNEIGGYKITPGMIANVNIITGQRTLLNKLMGPINGSLITAMNER